MEKRVKFTKNTTIRTSYTKPNYRDKKERIIDPKRIKHRDPIGDKEAFMTRGLTSYLR
ncbi:MAG: hypothetical protein RQ885_08990 [Desulfurococcales archaeon]|nr:hypothetical protein [Desulfurococcales archaeon]